MTREEIVTAECPVCASFSFEASEDGESGVLKQACPHCGWEYDSWKIKDPCFREENGLSLEKYREWFRLQKANNPEYDYTHASHTRSSHLCTV